MDRSCVHRHPDGRPCHARPLTKGRFCYWHDPDKSAEADEARRLGGLRRKPERTVATAYDLAGLGDVAQVRRLYEIAAFDTLGLENSPARNPLLIALAEGATRLLEVERAESLDLALSGDD